MLFPTVRLLNWLIHSKSANTSSLQDPTHFVLYLTYPLWGDYYKYFTLMAKVEKTTKQQALHRIKIIQGHLRAVEKMIENDEYCIDIVHQSMAVQKALKRLDMALMKEHLGSCVVEQFQNNQFSKSIDELMTLYEMK